MLLQEVRRYARHKKKALTATEVEQLVAALRSR